MRLDARVVVVVFLIVTAAWAAAAYEVFGAPVADGEGAGFELGLVVFMEAFCCLVGAAIMWLLVRFIPEKLHLLVVLSMYLWMGVAVLMALAQIANLAIFDYRDDAIMAFAPLVTTYAACCSFMSAKIALDRKPVGQAIG